MTDTLPDNALEPKDRAAWRDWLAAHHHQAQGVWLVMRKRASGRVNLTYNEAVEEALCFGWVDSKPRTLDQARSLLYMAPRRAGSGWSKLNKTRIERLIREERLTAAGLAKVRAAQLDGSWNKLDAVEALEVPDDLAAALLAYPPAAQLFGGFPRSVQRAVLEWIASARTAQTCRQRVEETAQLAQRSERAHQWRRPKRL